jgi:hypothetical protein
MHLLLSTAALLGIVLFTPVAGADVHVSLECSSETYAPGGSVRFVWRNDTGSTVVAAHHPPYEICTLGNALLYWGPIPWEYHLVPHTAVELVWDQRDGYGDPVPPGAYQVRIYYVFNDAPPGHVVSDDFLIQTVSSVPEDDPGIDAADWGAVKAAFR